MLNANKRILEYSEEVSAYLLDEDGYANSDLSDELSNEYAKKSKGIKEMNYYVKILDPCKVPKRDKMA